jgi:hypothetical protein
MKAMRIKCGACLKKQARVHVTYLSGNELFLCTDCNIKTNAELVRRKSVIVAIDY